MRLIDADKLVDLIDAEIPQDGEDDYTNGLAKAMEIILKMYFDKSVDAIPIEWITDWLTKQSIPATSYGIDYSAVEQMIEDWEKENEID